MNQIREEDESERAGGFEDQPLSMQRALADDSLQSLHYQLDNQSIIDDVRLSLQGIRYESRGGQMYEIRTRQLLNDEGISRVLIVLNSLLNKIPILSQASEDTTNQLCYYLSMTLLRLLDVNYDRFGIEDYAELPLIIQTIMNPIQFTLNKSNSGVYMKFLRSTHTSAEYQMTQNQNKPQQEKRGLFKSMLRR